MTHDVIHDVLLRCISDIIHFHSPVPCKHFSRLSSVSSPCIMVSSFGVSFDAGATAARSTDAVLRMFSSSIVTVVIKNSIKRNGPFLTGGSLLYDSSAKRSAPDVVISCGSRYTYCLTLTFSAALRIPLLWSPL